MSDKYSLISNEHFLFLNCLNYKINKNNDIINIINFGEFHGLAPKFNFDIFKNEKNLFLL